MIRKPLLAFLAFALIASVSAQTAAKPTAIHADPDPNSPVIHTVEPGERLPTQVRSAPAAPGWIAVTLAGPHEVFVENRFIDKELNVKPGSPLHTAAKSDSPVLTTSAKTDEIEITGLRGRWTQLRVNKTVLGYVEGVASAAPAPVPSPSSRVTTAPVQDAPAPSARPAATPSNRPAASGAGRQVERSAEERASLAALPRLFEGKLSSTRSPLRPRRPYDFALEAEDGTRFAYVDLTKLLLTEQIEKYLGHTVVVYGVARPVPDTKDIVISVESLQLR